MWGIDHVMQGPYEEQADMLQGPSFLVNNHHNNKPADGAYGCVVCTQPNAGCGHEPGSYWYQRETHALDAGLAVVGYGGPSAAGWDDAQRTSAFDRAVQVGGRGSWVAKSDTSQRSMIEIGVDISDYFSRGIYIHDPQHVPGSPSVVTAHALIVDPSAGNVGIGTTSPAKAKLVTDGQVGNTSAIFGVSTTGVSLIASWPAVMLNSYWNGGAKSLAAGYTGSFWMNPTDGRFEWRTGTQAGAADQSVSETVRLVILNGGNVGIATTSPSQKLEIGGEVLVKGADGWATAGHDAMLYLGDSNHTVKAIRGGGGTIGGLVFQTLNAGDHAHRFRNSSGTDLVYIKANDGNVGIGTTSPGEKLEVNGNIKFGTEGIKISTGTGVPSGGNDGDIYIRKDDPNTNICIKVGNSWKQCTLQNV
jgi:hypothetical protein